MRTIIISISVAVLLYSFSAKAEEYYSVSDPDGYVNLRNGPSTQDPVLARVNHGDCVIGVDQINGWTRVLVFELKVRTLRTGYIHGSRLRKNEYCRETPSVQAIPMGDIVMESLNRDKGFLHAVDWYERNSNRIADDGYYAEGYSDYVMKTLAKSFHSNVESLNTLNGTHVQFVQFVLRHIDPTGSVDDLEAIASHAPECSDESGICKDIVERAKASLHAGIADEVSALDINQVKAMLQKEDIKSVFNYLVQDSFLNTEDKAAKVRTNEFLDHIEHGDKEWFSIVTQFYKAGLIDGIYGEVLSGAVDSALSTNPELVFLHWKVIGNEPECGSWSGDIGDPGPVDTDTAELLKELLPRRLAVSNVRESKWEAVKNECLVQINSRIKNMVDYAKANGFQVEINGTNFTIRSK